MLRAAYLDVSLLPEVTNFPAFTQYRREKISRLMRAEDKALSAGAELLLRVMLYDSGYRVNADTVFNISENGKPYLTDSVLEFNLSHSGTVCACAVSDSAVGIDVEKISPCRETIVKQYFSLEEQTIILHADDRDAAFTRLWTEKEAVIKQQGSSIGTMLRVLMQNGTRAYCRQQRLTLSTVNVGDYHLSVCARELLAEEPENLTQRVLTVLIR